MEQKQIPKLTIIEGRKTYHGVDVILTHYYIICDPHIVFGIWSIGKIPCTCIDCINLMYLPWYTSLVTKDHPGYYSVTKW